MPQEHFYRKTHMNKKQFFSIGTALVLCLAALTACVQPGETSQDGLSKATYTFTNLSAEFPAREAPLETYYQEKSEVPYVGIESFITALDGVLDPSGLESTVSEEEGEYILRDTRGGLRVLTADWEEDTLSVSSYTFFNSLVKDTGETDYGAHIEALSQWATPSASVTFDLGEYGFDILYADGQALLPFCIANLLFCSINLYNVYFNGEAYFGVLQSDLPTMTPADWAELRTSPWNGTEASAELRELTVSFLEFALDHFYGLKEYKGIDTFKNVITGELREALLSGDPQVHNAAYVDLFQKTLNELHTTLSTPSFYASADAVFDLTGENGGTRREESQALYTQLAADLVASVGEPVELPDGSMTTSLPAVRFEGDTAIILLTGFTVGTHDQIYNEDGTISENAQQYDTYYFMRRAMDSIAEHEAEGSPVENVVIDLTLNTGGSLAAMISALGFLTDEPIPYTTGNLLDGSASVAYYLVDADGDGDCRDEDAYDEFNWYVLTSPLTYSAGNLFTAIVKETGIATVMGEQSGGGTCAVFTLVLPDGMTTNMSGADTVLETILYEQGVPAGGALVESGIIPDIALDRTLFYNDEALIAAIRGANGAIA